MNDIDAEKRDLLKTLPIAPALLLGGAVGLTATPAQGHPALLQFVLVRVGTRVVVRWLIGKICDPDTTFEKATRSIENDVKKIRNALDNFRRNNPPILDDAYAKINDNLKGALREIGWNKQAQVAIVEANNGTHLPVAKTDTHFAVFLT